MLESFIKPVTEEQAQDEEHPIILRSSRSYFALSQVYSTHDFWVKREESFEEWLGSNLETTETEQPQVKPGLIVTCEAVESSIIGFLEWFIPRGVFTPPQPRSAF